MALRVVAEARIQNLGSRDWPTEELQAGVYVALRSGGQLKAERWELATPWVSALPVALAMAVQRIEPAGRDGIDGVEVCLNYRVRDIKLPRDEAALDDIHRGIRGLEIVRDGVTNRWSPTQMLAQNLDFDQALQRSAEERRLQAAVLRLPDTRLRTFEVFQFFVRPGSGVVLPMFRGNQLVATGEVTSASMKQAAAGMGGWLARQVQPDGRMVYRYLPSRGEEATGNNVLRQMMATVSLGRWAGNQDDGALRELQRRNLRYNFGKFYREEVALGLIEEGDEVKLGSTALAGLALVESPWRPEFAKEVAAILRLVRNQWLPHGEFRTYYRPSTKTGNVNFYPGEALVLWATLIERGERPDLLTNFMASFRHYRTWHLNPANRDPAFIPWHTQAYVAVWKQTKSEELRDFVFLMNDWLLNLQEWDEALYPDVRGRFFDPLKPEYGPPHASSTGVYLEGLADAFWLARETGDALRVERYRLAILRGVRNILQLQFADDVDLFYVSNRDKVAGAIRTTEYNNEIRVDNVQHNLMGFLKILGAFRAEDYAWP